MNRSDWKMEFSSRLRRREDELRWLYLEAFSDDYWAYEYFIAMLYRRWDSRPERFKRLDRAREEAPRWYLSPGLIGMRLGRGENWDADHIARCGVTCLFLPDGAGGVPARGEEGLSVCLPFRLEKACGENPTAFNDLTDSLLQCVNQGADALCLENVPSLPKPHPVLRMLRLACETVCPSALLIGGEGADPSWFGTEQKPECHLLFDGKMDAVLWHTAATRDLRLLSHELERRFSPHRERAFLYSLRGQDGVRWDLDYGFLFGLGQMETPHRQYLNDYLTGNWPDSPARGEWKDGRLRGSVSSLCGLKAARETGDPEAAEKAVRLHLLLHALLYTLGGAPVLQSGDESARDTGETWAEPDAAGRRVYSAIQRMHAVRAENPAFSARADAWLWDTENEAVLGIGRRTANEQLLALFNFSDETQTAWTLDPNDYQNLVTGERTDGGSVLLPPGEFRWLLRRC
ncbi:MAG: Beta-galactosidase C-terminal domain [Clostridia bacterium]|nr:Beta-galactosidase C-terminal domain [Clostridia bacterium]